MQQQKKNDIKFVFACLLFCVRNSPISQCGQVTKMLRILMNTWINIEHFKKCAKEKLFGIALALVIKLNSCFFNALFFASLCSVSKRTFQALAMCSCACVFEFAELPFCQFLLFLIMDTSKARHETLWWWMCYLKKQGVTPNLHVKMVTSQEKNANYICTLSWWGLVDIIAVVVMMHLWREPRFILIKWNGKLTNTHKNPYAFTRTPLHVCTSNWLHATLLIIH